MSKKVVSIIIIILLGVLFLLSSYTWLSSKDNEVEKISINISSKDIDISTDKNTWKKVIVNKDINNGIIPTSYESVSTAFEVIDGKIKFFDNKELINDDSNKYVVFDLYFKSDENRKVYLSSNSKVYFKGKSVETEDSVRVAFVGDNIKTIWEPNCDTHSIASINNAYENKKVYLKEKNFLKQKYNGIQGKDSYSEVETIGTNKNNTDDIELFNITKGVSKVKVYMWIEEEDIDMFSDIIGDSLTYNLEFFTRDGE